MQPEHLLERKFPDGCSIKAWLGDHEGSPHVMVQWCNANNQPCAQPFMVPLPMASAVFREMTAFAEDVAGHVSDNRVEKK